MRMIFAKISGSYAKYYSPTEHLADEVIVLFKGRVIFKQYISKKHKQFGTKSKSFVTLKRYTYDMRVNSGKDRTHTTGKITSTHATVAGLTSRFQTVGHELYRNIFLSSL
jgi:ABC-type uncharacterized transport system ATPase subunit